MFNKLLACDVLLFVAGTQVGGNFLHLLHLDMWPLNVLYVANLTIMSWFSGYLKDFCYYFAY